METEGSLPCLQQSASWQPLGPDESSQCLPIFSLTLCYTLPPSKPASAILSLWFTFLHHNLCNPPHIPSPLPQLIWTFGEHHKPRSYSWHSSLHSVRYPRTVLNALFWNTQELLSCRNMAIQRYRDTLVQWYIDRLTQWEKDTLIQWYNDTMIQWEKDTLIEWYNDTMRERYINRMIQWYHRMTY